MNARTAALPLLLGLLMAACASPDAVQGADSQPSVRPAGGAEQVVEAEIAWHGTVTAIDPGARLVSLRDPQGQERTFRIEEQVRRLETLQVGDRVEVYYRRSLVFDMQPAGSAEPGAYIWDDVQHPDPARPGVVDREVVVALSPVVAVNTDAHTLSVRSPNGSIHVLEVEEPRHREALPRVRVGDLLRIQFRRVLAVRVSPEA